ncbi:hypothetical protein AG1IA_00712 [Rhizoctonia solani AG-1 IA]|uniref:Uncharacterized protein n=1 Tax=Thanatephorus cucumeris (strain AG1-IA) TaxID=983506 RepID=L8X4P1_THACA|nr:hypothetical protein AG1IA_00712 [Rhizoctonia solani AG-1 IA]
MSIRGLGLSGHYVSPLSGRSYRRSSCLGFDSNSQIDVASHGTVIKRPMMGRLHPSLGVAPLHNLIWS